MLLILCFFVASLMISLLLTRKINGGIKTVIGKSRRQSRQIFCLRLCIVYRGGVCLEQTVQTQAFNHAFFKEDFLTI